MTTPLGLGVAVGAFLGALAITRAIRDFASRRQLVDRPNERSAHATPTPRLGGLGIILPFLAGALVLAGGTRHGGHLVVVLAATTTVALLGLIDDLRPLPAWLRFAVQGAAAVTVVLSRREDLAAVLAPFDTLFPTAALAMGAVLWIVWTTNLYNFMDGIDGLAGGQAVSASLGLAVAAFSIGDPLVAWVLVSLAASSAGFLRFNLPKASIFMGDVGSTAIGFFLACLPFASSGRPLPLLAVALAISLFFMDATTTLVRRVLQGERWFEAHRTHIYQRPLALGVPHARITYAGYVGMAIVAALAGYYPRAESFIQGLMHGGAVVLFAVAWWVVRRMEQGAARMETRADAQPSSRSA